MKTSKKFCKRVPTEEAVANEANSFMTERFKENETVDTDATAKKTRSGRRMKRKRICCLSLVFILIISMFSIPVSAAETGKTAGETDPSFVTTGTYQYTAVEDKNKQLSDSFTFREDCFMRSSYLGCDHLMLLSAQAAIASANRYIDEKESDNGQNIRNMLQGMGFQDVETNNYYSLVKLDFDDSAGVAVGQRTIHAFGKDYTLLAIIPRSGGYSQEWSGNFDVGTGSIHKGFKAGRDEILCFVKQYISKHDINGNLKVWIAGHSRGAGMANLLGGFFAGGGIGYFGGEVSITPEDVYCYNFAGPRSILTNFSLTEALSVDGARAGYYEGNDTPGEDYVSSASGTGNPQDEIYNGIRNYPLSYDVVPKMPAEIWGYTYYGNVWDITDGLTVDDMTKELALLSQDIYQEYMTNGDVRGFREKSFDPATLSFVDQEGGASGQAGMEAFDQRLISGLLYTTGDSVKSYVDSGSQTALQALAGSLGQLAGVFMAHAGEVSMPALLGYLAYASQHLQEEGRAANDAEAAAIAIAELIQFITGVEIDLDHATIDDIFRIIAEYIARDPDTKLIEKLKDLIEGNIPDNMLIYIDSYFGQFCTDPKATTADKVLAFLIAAANGADPNSEAWKNNENYRTAAGVRKALYSVMGFVLPYSISQEIGYDGSAAFKNVVTALLPLLLKGKDEAGADIQYSTIADAADAGFKEAIDKMMPNVYTEAEKEYSETYVQLLRDDVEGVKANITKCREALFNTLLPSDGAFNTEKNVCSISTLISNGVRMTYAHFNIVFIAWAKAAVNANRENSDHSISYVAYEKLPGYPERYAEYWLYHDVAGDAKYKDRYLSKEGMIIHTSGGSDHVAKEYVIRYDANGGTGAPASQKKKNGQTIVLTGEVPTWEGHTFLNWNTGRDGSGTAYAPGDSYTANADAVLYAQWASSIPPAVELPFKDVAEDAWYCDAVNYVYDHEIMTGMTADYFGAAEKLSRAQFATILYRLAEPTGVVYEQEFPDVKETDWFGLPVSWASMAGVITGYTSGYFGPADEITREQIAVMLYRYANSQGYDTSKKADFSGYPDAKDVSDWATEAMKWAVGEGILTGQGGVYLDPVGNATRAECAAMIMRFMERYL